MTRPGRLSERELCEEVKKATLTSSLHLRTYAWTEDKGFETITPSRGSTGIALLSRHIPEMTATLCSTPLTKPNESKKCPFRYRKLARFEKEQVLNYP